MLHYLNVIEPKVNYSLWRVTSIYIIIEPCIYIQSASNILKDTGRLLPECLWAAYHLRTTSAGSVKNSFFLLRFFFSSAIVSLKMILFLSSHPPTDWTHEHHSNERSATAYLHDNESASAVWLGSERHVNDLCGVHLGSPVSGLLRVRQQLNQTFHHSFSSDLGSALICSLRLSCVWV